MKYPDGRFGRAIDDSAIEMEPATIGARRDLARLRPARAARRPAYDRGGERALGPGAGPRRRRAPLQAVHAGRQRHEPYDVLGLAWLGTRTEEFDEMCRFYGEVFGLPRVASAPGFAAYRLPSGDLVEVFRPDFEGQEHFTTGPVAGFAVEDIDAARAEMEANYIEFLGADRRRAGRLPLGPLPRPRRQRLRADAARPVTDAPLPAHLEAFLNAQRVARLATVDEHVAAARRAGLLRLRRRRRLHRAGCQAEARAGARAAPRAQPHRQPGRCSCWSTCGTKTGRGSPTCSYAGRRRSSKQATSKQRRCVCCAPATRSTRRCTLDDAPVIRIAGRVLHAWGAV